MAAHNLLQGRIRPDKEEDDFEGLTNTDTSGSSQEVASKSDSFSKLKYHPKPAEEALDNGNVSLDSESEIFNQDGASAEDESSSSVAEEPAHPTAHISFGALASAQASLGLKRKREPVTTIPRRTSRSPSPFHEAQERRAGKKKDADSATRQSKHAPAVQSSKKAVSRKRTVVHVPASGARDPRFSSLSGHADEQRVERNYEFLNDYRKTELAVLQRELRETKNTTRRDELKRLVRAMEDRERARKAVEAERAVRQEHRQQEREKVKEGKKPYFLKRSEVKKKMHEKDFEELGPRKAEKRMERRRKKVAAKERRDMPQSRREMRDTGG